MHDHLLIATDGSDVSNRAIESGLALARRLGSRVSIVTVTEEWSVLEMAHKARAGAQHPIEDYEAIARTHAREILRDADERAKAAEVECATLHVVGRHPAEAIVETAVERGCDTIVMASHGRRGLDKLLIGSQTARVLALTTLPVLVYR